MKLETIEVKVRRKLIEATDIVSFELEAIDNKPLPPFSAGSHIDVCVPGGPVRQYSLCNEPEQTTHYQIAVLKEAASRGGSIGMHERVQEGDTLFISPPRNHFPLVPANRSLLLAGGIGITPILCMADRLAQTGADFAMHYCSRSIERTAFLHRIRTSTFSDRVSFHFDDAGIEQKLDLESVIRANGSGIHLYVCGPAGFIDYAVNTAKACGLDSSQIHYEFFGAKPVETTANDSFEVKIASTGQCYRIPADQSVVNVLETHGISIPVSCEQGVCGTCITRVLDGVPDHRDVYFTDEEKAVNDQFTPCCSRAKSPLLVLDL